jgi:hypothetical protein
LIEIDLPQCGRISIYEYVKTNKLEIAMSNCCTPSKSEPAKEAVGVTAQASESKAAVSSKDECCGERQAKREKCGCDC